MSRASRRGNQDRQNAARDVVERTRAGDQVAMGILAMVRDNAKLGNPKAQQSLRAIERYISKNPPIGIGSEVSDITSPHAAAAISALWQNPTHETIVKALPLVGFWPGVVALSHGPNLDNERLGQLSSVVPEEHRPAFQGGVNHWQSKTPNIIPDERGWLLGRIIGLARCLQLVRLPHVAVATFCPITAWELGE